ncbi:MAG: ATP-binding protein [Firmicutes bacterium]|nr:ATP-binding protein [Bacillota bacterium]
MDKDHRFSSGMFRQLVLINFIKELTLSFTGFIDYAVVGRYLGADGLSGMKLVMPVFSIFELFSVVLATGQSISMSRDLSRGSREEAEKTIHSITTLIMILGSVFLLLGVSMPKGITRLFAGSEVPEIVLEEAAAYLLPAMASAIPIMLFDTLGAVLLLEGADRTMFYASIVIFAVDLIGDLLAVLLNGGMAGIAITSGIAYLAADAVILHHFRSGKSMFRLRLGRLNRTKINAAAVYGLPMVVVSLCEFLDPVTVNRLIVHYGSETGLAALSIQDALHYFPLAISRGVASATMILAGIFVSEKDQKALLHVRERAVRWSLIGGSLIALGLLLLSRPVLWVFTDDPDVLKASILAMRIYLIGIPFMIYNSSGSAFSQGAGEKSRSSLHILCHHLLLPVLLAWVLGHFFGMVGVFSSFPAAEILMTVITLIVHAVEKHHGEHINGEKSFAENILAELHRNVYTMEEAEEAAQAVNDLCLKYGVSEKKAYQLSLCTEELASNSLLHGFTDGKKHHLDIRLVIEKSELILRVRDDCRKFDLTEQFKLMNPDDPTKNIGLRLIYANADEVSYSNAIRLNNICIRMKLENPEE